MMTYKFKYDIGDLVYLVTDTEQTERMITAIQIDGDKTVEYFLRLGTSSSWHHDIEITLERNLLKLISSN